jgi:rsbT antagonist protein RsbS
MTDASQLPRVTINLMRGCLVATIQFDLTRAVLDQFRKDLLARLAGANAREIILDCSGIEVMDAEDFDALRRTVAMASLMGARTVIAGLQPGVVSALVAMDVDLDGLQTALSLDDAFRLLERGEPDIAPSQPGRAESATNDAIPQ